MTVAINHHVVEAFSVRSEHHEVEFLAFITRGPYERTDV
eukprot:CAMPEP_0185748200 /NCGR_PEP_ID=MMETSP1174-20130828/6873_1 /TAXON_ID=35687 /ORGANISM="Dictyocha speculum, Strain CCMP1381" /LENGTH=38 /DNA_ID= /DNA_START= /DNA_END= /DNA_ORIENTATION=